tara:strand:+ start:140 stop:475 length:336 start_codon:yes stop_codon:yes gene_type:complete
MASRSLAVIEAQNVALGQAGSVLVTGTSAISCLTGAKVFIAIQFLEDTVFNSTDGLVAETEQLFPDDGGTSSLVSSNGATSDSVTFPAGLTIYGRWTGFILASGKVIAYVG